MRTGVRDASVHYTFFLFLSLLASANQRTVTWSATYYDVIPNKPGISKEYCLAHTPGTFIGSVNDQLKFGARTDNGVLLDSFTFNVSKKQGIYFLQGTLRARGKYQGKPWEDHITYYCYKLSEYSLTRGVWASNECKGFFQGNVVTTDKYISQ